MHATMARPLARRVAPGLQSRLAAWADHRLLPVVVALLLLLDAGMAANWLLSPAANLASPAYMTAKQLASMPTYGAIFAFLTTLSTASVLGRGRSWLAGWLLGGTLGGFWFFWAVMFALAPIGTTGASYAGAVFALPLCLLHLLAGLVLTHRPEGPPGTRKD